MTVSFRKSKRMKIKVKAIFGEYERTFEIACGTGEQKTFKWLGNAVSQRFALSIPNGGLRHRDHFRGTTERAQHTCAEIRFTDGQMPHPTAILSDFLRDGDEVLATFVADLPCEAVTGFAKFSKWAHEAFATNGGPQASDDTNDGDAKDSDPSLLVTVKSKADFMRLVLGSQMLNMDVISNQVNSQWGMVTAAMPGLSREYAQSFKAAFQSHWLPLFECFCYISPDGLMTLDNFRRLIEEVELFSTRDAAAFVPRVHRRTCSALQCSNSFGIGGLLVAIILCSQLRHNDTLEHDSPVTGPADAVMQILEKNIIPFAEKINLPCVLKLVFCSDEVLFGIRMHHDEMFAVFEKYASKSNILPTSLKLEHLGECLVAATLFDVSKEAAKDPYREAAINKDKAKLLFDACRTGVIVGRGRVNPMLDEPKFADEPVPENELIFPEFVECAARAGVTKFFRTALGLKEDGEPLTLGECMMKGVKAVVSTLNPPQQVTGFGRK